jgi:hypothetical protein
MRDTKFIVHVHYTYTRKLRRKLKTKSGGTGVQEDMTRHDKTSQDETGGKKEKRVRVKSSGSGGEGRVQSCV